MIYIFIALSLLVLVALVLWIFINTKPKTMIDAARLVIPVSLMALGVIATIAGQGKFGIPAIIIAAIWWYYYLRPAKNP